MRTLTVVIIALILSLIGFGTFFYKYKYLEFPLSADKQYNSWYIETKFELHPKAQWGEKAAMIKFKVPNETADLAIVDEKFIAKGFGRETSEDKHQNRIAEFTKRNLENNEIIYYRAIAYQLSSSSEDEDEIANRKANSPYSKKNRPSIIDENDVPVYNAIDSLIDEARQKSADNSSFVRELAKILNKETDERVAILMDRLSDQVKTLPALAALLIEAADIPVDIVNGIKLENEVRKAEFVQWLNVYIDNERQPFNFDEKKYGVPKHYLPWWYGNDTQFAETKGLKNYDLFVSVRKNTDNSLTRALWKSEQAAKFFHKFSLYNLPIDSQLIYKILLMIPIGGLVIAFLRQIIGLKTFGTFMPVLVALSFKQTGLIHGILFFTMVVIVGMMIRSYFHKLQLLLVPRLAGVLTIVVLIIAVIGVLAHELEFDIGLSIALFPIVILTMTIERMTIMWEETGPKEAIQTGIGSLVAATVGFVAMNNEILKHLVFTFPELLLINLALCMLLGRYNGYKITEYYRFRKLNRQIEAKKLAEKK